MSPAASGVSPSLVIWSPFSAATTCRVQSTPGRGRRLGHGGRQDLLRPAVPVGQRPEPLDRHPGRRPRPGLLVVGGLVDVDYRVQAGVKRRQHRIVPQRGLVQPVHRALLEQERRPQPLLGHQLRGHRRQPRRGRRRPAAAGTPAPPAAPRPCRLLRRPQHPPHKRGVQERHVGGADKRHLGPSSDRGQPRRQPLHRPQPLPRILHDFGLAEAAPAAPAPAPAPPPPARPSPGRECRRSASAASTRATPAPPWPSPSATTARQPARFQPSPTCFDRMPARAGQAHQRAAGPAASGAGSAGRAAGGRATSGAGPGPLGALHCRWVQHPASPPDGDVDPGEDRVDHDPQHQDHDHDGDRATPSRSGPGRSRAARRWTAVP